MKKEQAAGQLARRAALGAVAFNISEQGKRAIEDAGGIRFDEGDWLGFWMLCDAFASGAHLSGDAVLSAKEIGVLEAVARSGKEMVDAISRLSNRSNSLLQTEFMKNYFPDGIYNALSLTTPQLVSPPRILEWSTAAEKAQREARPRRKGEREFAPDARAFVLGLRGLYDETVIRSSGIRSPNAGFKNFFLAVYERLPLEAQQRLTSPEAALKSAQRKRQRDK